MSATRVAPLNRSYAALVLTLVSRSRSGRASPGRGAWGDWGGARGAPPSHSAMPLELLRLAGGLLGDHHVHERRALEGHRLLQRGLQILRVLDEPALAAEGLHHLVVARAVDQRVRPHVLQRVLGMLRVARPDAAVVEHDDLDRELIAAHRLHLHAG